jgi:membrane-associated phospholipid phosphatase
MDARLKVLRQRRTDWIITWHQNRVRWVLFYYLVGLILSCLFFFVEEVFFPLPARYFHKSLTVLVWIPCATVLVSIAATNRNRFLPTMDADPPPEVTAPQDFFQRYAQILLALLMFGIWAAGYYFIAFITEAHTTHTLPTLAWEREVPLTPEFVFIYLTIYPTFLLPFLFIHQKDFFRLFSFAYITVMCVCYLVYLFYPVSIDRPELVVNSFSTWVLDIVYGADRPWNCFPSLHVAMSLLAALTILEVHRIRGMLTLLLTCWIAFSTVLIKQHYVLDVVAAMVLTVTIYFVYIRRRILNTLYVNILRAEETLEKWINRKIDTRVWESLDGPLRTRVREMVQAIIDESLGGPKEHRHNPRPITEGDPPRDIQEDKP